MSTLDYPNVRDKSGQANDSKSTLFLTQDCASGVLVHGEEGVEGLFGPKVQAEGEGEVGHVAQGELGPLEDGEGGEGGPLHLVAVGGGGGDGQRGRGGEEGVEEELGIKYNLGIGCCILMNLLS